MLMAGMAASPAAAAQSAHSLYTRALARERQLRLVANKTTLPQLRAAVAAYENVVRRYPRSGYSDNALWQGANLALLAFERFGQASDKRTALRLLNQLKSQYPSSSLVSRIADLLAPSDGARPAPVTRATSSSPPSATQATPPARGATAAPSAPRSGLPAAEAESGPSTESDGGTQLVTIRDIRRTPLPDGTRVSIEMDGESLFRSERLENPPRVFFDLKGTRTTTSLRDASIRLDDDVVREIRLGRHSQNTTRIVMDLEAIETYSVFTLYNPFRLVVDFRRASSSGPLPARGTVLAPPTASAVVEPGQGPAAPNSIAAAASEPVPLISRPVESTLVSPAAPTANGNGQFSIARQLGLGVSRIVLDAGHGGHDPGARANGLNEAELVLDVTLRLRALLENQPGFEVTLTRDKDVFVPLEERTAIANREGADLFLSIHANASRNPNARGIETYFLNFASNHEAEAVAARENASSGRAMRNLPDIVRAIALNNKIDESRDFAEMVQKSMVRHLASRSKQVRDLGVKQAPFVVLIGAGMPSVLAEISFVTNRQEAALLKGAAYRQQIAESLLDGILRYQRSLKGVRAIAARE
jgi:N-acetylmuramoyl-L-alanine amidase